MTACEQSQSRRAAEPQRGRQRIVFETGSGSGRIVAHLSGHNDTAWCCAMSRDGTRVESGGEDNTVHIWDVATCSTVGPPLHGHKNWVHCLAWSADNKRVVSGSFDRTVRLWASHVHTAQPIGDPIVHDKAPRCVQTDAHGKEEELRRSHRLRTTVGHDASASSLPVTTHGAKPWAAWDSFALRCAVPCLLIRE